MRNAMLRTLAVALFAISAMSPVLGNAHAAQEHLVIGTGIYRGSPTTSSPIAFGAAVLYADTEAYAGTVIATVPSGTGRNLPQLQTITLDCFYIVKSGGAHTMYASGNAEAQRFYVTAVEGSKPNAIYISRVPYSGFCGTGGGGYAYRGPVAFVDR